MIVIIAIITTGMTGRIGHTAVIYKTTIGSTVLITISEAGTRGTTGDGVTIIRTTKSDTTIGARSDTNRSRRQVW
jgi:hypothetical protein